MVAEFFADNFIYLPYLKNSTMATTNFYLDLRGKAKDRRGSILITLSHNCTHTTIPTGIRVLPEEWDGQKIVHAPGKEALNAELSEKIKSINKAIALLSMDSSFEYMTAAQIKSKIVKKKAHGSDYSVKTVFKEYMSNNLKPGTVKIYDSTLKKVLAFGGQNCNITDIDLKWLHRFERFLSRTQGVNGRAIYLRSLRAVCNYANHTGMMFTYPFKNFSIKQEQTKKRSISVGDLRKLIAFPVSGRTLMFRDYFLIMFYLIGINAKDLLLATDESIVNGRLEYIRAKTGKKYSIKIEPEAYELINRHKGKGYLLDALDHCKHYQCFLHELNDNLKLIGDVSYESVPNSEDLFGEPEVIKKVTPVIPQLSTYYARHSWATIAYEIGIPLDIISQALGHSSGNRTTLIYVKYDQKKVDEANRKVLDYVLYGTT